MVGVISDLRHLNRPRLFWSGFALLLLATLVVRLMLLVGGIRGSDAYAYAHSAWLMVTGAYDPLALGGNYYAYRYGLLLPTAFAYTLLGPTDLASMVFPLVASLGTAALIGSLGRMLWDRQTGVIAMALWATFPLAIVPASMVSPDSVIPFYATLGVWAFLKAQEASDEGGSGPHWYFWSGLACGLAVLSRLTSVLILLVPLALMLRQPCGMRCWVPFTAGLAVPLGLAGGYLAYMTGDPLFEIHQIAFLSRKLSQESGSGDLAYYLKAFLGLSKAGVAWYTGMPLVAAAGLWIGWQRRDRNVGLLAWWTIPVLLALTFGSMSVTEYIPILKNYNYLSLVASPMVLLAAHAIRSWLGPDGPKPQTAACAVALAVSVLLLASGPYGAYRISTNIKNDSAPYIAAAEALKNLPEDTVYLPRVRWPYFLAYHLGYRAGAAEYVPLDAVRSPDDITHGYVVVHDRYLKLDEAGLPLSPDRHAPVFFLDPPSHWRALVRFQGHPAYNRMVLYRVGPLAETR